jgi:hypothetical protein
MWYPYHALAYLALLLLVSGLIALVVFAQSLGDREAIRGFFSSIAPDLPTVAPILAVALIGALILWVAMLRHHLRQPQPRSVAWTALLIFLNWGAAIAYFFLVWRPTHIRVGT